MKKIIIALGFISLMGASGNAVFAGYFNTTPVNACPTQITHTLQFGSQNDDVYVLQNMLSRAGYLYASPNGYFGYGTKSAVKSFQNANGISPTGSVGETTLNAVNERLCDDDPRGESVSYNSYNYGYSSGVTYVDQYDPYAIVVSPRTITSSIYATPQINSSIPVPQATITSGVVYSSGVTGYNSSDSITPATSQVLLQSSGIVYNANSGYSYGYVPKPGSLTIGSPVSNAVYGEGDTVNVSWALNNIQASQFKVLLENTITGQSKIATITSGNSTSFVLTKELLDSVCAGVCNNDQQGSFRVVISTPFTDIAGITNDFRSAIAPITIKRPYSFASAVTITTSKTPVDSGEKFKLYLNIPSGTSWNNTTIGNYSIKVRAICPPSVSVVVAGVSCGQDFVIPFAPVSFQQEIPAMITNPTWYRQDVTFEVLVTSLNGQVIGTSRTTVTTNAAPFSW